MLIRGHLGLIAPAESAMGEIDLIFTYTQYSKYLISYFWINLFIKEQFWFVN